MSYILDALRRADAERERGRVPGIHAQPTRMAPSVPVGAAKPAPRSRLLAAAAVLVVLLLLWLTWRVAGDDATGPVGGGSGTPIAGTASTIPALGVPGAPIQTPAATAAAPVPSVSNGGDSLTSTAPAATSDHATVHRAPARKPALVSAAKSPAASSAAFASGQAVPASGAGNNVTPAKLYKPDELPDDVRRELPKLAIGGSIYSESPASRFVIVNGQLCHEGDTLAPGLVLQQIKLKSVVLAFRGYRYAMTF